MMLVIDCECCSLKKGTYPCCWLWFSWLKMCRMLMMHNDMVLWNVQTGITTFKLHCVMLGWSLANHLHSRKWWLSNRYYSTWQQLVWMCFHCDWLVARYYHLLKKGFKVIWETTNSYTVEEKRTVHHSLFCLATDLSMLRLFEAFLESVPQLLLQLYIVLDHDNCSVMQCKCRQ